MLKGFRVQWEKDNQFCVKSPCAAHHKSYAYTGDKKGQILDQ